MLKSFKEFVIEQLSFNKNVKEIKYFSSNGVRSIPNAPGIVKGGFFLDCMNNSKKFKSENYQYFINENFELFDAIRPEQYGLSDYRGGVLIFSTDVNSLDLSKNKLLNWFNKKIKSVGNKFFSKSKLTKIIGKFNNIDKTIGDEKIDDVIGAFSIGNFFSGRYIGDNGKVFDEKSLSIEINGISSKGLIYVAEEIAINFNQEAVLVKDFNKNKIYLVDKDKNGSYDLTNINSKSL